MFEQNKELLDAINRVHERIDAVHGRISEISDRVSEVKGRVSEMPKKQDMYDLIGTHSKACESRRRWTIGMLLGVPGVLVAILTAAALLSSRF